ncbi:MAG: hypothetical protein Tsb0013_17400 [Phycisphaerales bacterium]
MTTPANQNTTIIAADAHFKGEMTFEGSAKVLGTFDGTITSKGEMAVGKGATCNANVHAGRIVVDGTVNGDLQGDELIELNAGAKVTGDITAGNLVVVEGASFEGHVRVGSGMTMKKAPAQPAQTQTQTQNQTASDRPQVQTRSMRPASTASETAASPSAASAAVARATADAANGTSWLKGDASDSQDEQHAA